MLIRLMMIAFLLIISAMPVRASEKDVPPTEITAEQMTMEDALSKVTIESEDWLDGDTYYIRYTFTNPTDVGIEKDILYTNVALFAYWNNTCSKITKVDNSPNQHLSIAPHSETTMLLSFPKEYTHDQYSFRSACFYFATKDLLAYDTYSVTPEIPIKTADDLLKKNTCPVSFDIAVIPPKEKNGLSELLLTIDNQTPQEINSMKDLSLWGSCYVPSIDRIARLNFAQSNPIEVDISPYSQKTLTYSTYIDYGFNDGRIVPNPYSLSVSLDDQRYTKPFIGHIAEIAYRTTYHIPKQTAGLTQDITQPLYENVFFYTKGNKVHCFFKVHNQYDKPCVLSYIYLYWDYLTPFYTTKYVHHSFNYHTPIHLRPNESRYYTFSFDVPTDYSMPCDTLTPRFHCTFYTSQDRFRQHFIFKEQKLPPIQQAIYQPLPPLDIF